MAVPLMRYSHPGRFAHALTACLLALALLACSLAPAAFAEGLMESEGSSQVVKVGCIEYGGYYSHDAQNGRYGYIVDYLDELAHHTGWKYEYVDFASFSEAKAALLDGGIDLLPAVSMSDLAGTGALSSRASMGEAMTTLSVMPDDDRYFYEDFEAFEGARVGMVEGSSEAIAFEAYRLEHGFTVTVSNYQAAMQVLEALEAGDIDMAVLTFPGKGFEIEAVAEFSPEALFIGVALEEDDLLATLDRAMGQMLQRDADYIASIFETHLGISADQDPVFTREETAYMATAPRLTVAYEVRLAPLSFTSQAGAFDGMMALLFEDITRITGLEFDFIEAQTHTEMIRMVQSGEADLAAGIDRAADTESFNGFVATHSYISSPVTRVTSGAPSGLQIALPDGFPYDSRVIADYPGYEVVYYPDAQACIDAVADGSASMSFMNTYSANYYLADTRYNGLDSVNLNTHLGSMCLGVSTAADPLLFDVLERCVRFTDSATVNQWVTASSLKPQEYSVTDIIRRYPLQSIAFFVALTLALAVIGMLVYRSRIKARESIERATYVDALTGGWNLTRFQEEAALRLAQADGQSYALAYVNVDRFKSFNAAFGYEEGDRLLIALHDLIGEVLQGEECYARVSADKFVALLKWEGIESHKERFRKLDEAINGLELLGEKSYRVSIFEGICEIDQQALDAGTSLSELIDYALYACRSIGDASRSTVALYTDDMRRRAIDEKLLQGEAEKALANGEFTAYYQPTVDIDTGQIASFEALARWISPEKGLRSPGEFVPLLEKNGFIVEVDFYIFRLACERLRSRIEQGKGAVRIASNFSRLHMRNKDFTATLKRIVDEYEVPAEYLTVEMTEDLVMEDKERAKAVCSELQDLGFKTAIDDFGSGYSSLGMLEEMPIDIIKLDRTFLINAETTARSRMILRGVVDIACALGFDIIVEGVETQKQVDTLKALQVPLLMQGYYYSRPVPLGESEAQLDAGRIGTGR